MITRTLLTGLALMVATGGASAQDRSDREARREELRQRIRDLTAQLSELQSEQMRMNDLFVSVTPDVFSLNISGSRARMGVVVQTARDESVDSIGALIESVTEDAPAYDAGIRDGDIIVSFDGEELVGRYPPAGDRESEPAIKLIDLVREHEPGDRVEVVYRRGRDTRTTEVELEENRPSVFSFSSSGGDRPLGLLSRRGTVGVTELQTGPDFSVRIVGEFASMELVSINEDLGSYFGTDQGVLVITAPDEEFGLEAGDVILKIGDRSVDEPSRAFRILGSYEPGEEVTMEIMRHQQRQTVQGTVPENDRVYWNRR